MKKITKILILLILLTPFVVNAENIVDNTIIESEVNEHFTTKFEEDVETSKNVNGSSITAGNNVISNNTVNGFNMVFGNNVKYEGNSEYALFLGNILEVSGNIEKDGFIFGNIITFNDNFVANRDLFVFASEVKLEGIINRDITIYASKVVIENTQVMGNITIYAPTIEVDNTTVDGIMSYNEDSKITISDNNLINETKLLETILEKQTVVDKIAGYFVSYLDLMVVFLILAFALPSIFRKLENEENIKAQKIFSSFGFGAMLLIAVPMVIILLFTTTIGITSAVLLLLLYIIAICLANVLTGYLLGYIIWTKLIKKENNILLIGLIGISIIYVLQFIPTIGEIVSVFSLMFGLGLVLQLFKKQIGK